MPYAFFPISPAGTTTYINSITTKCRGFQLPFTRPHNPKFVTKGQPVLPLRLFRYRDELDLHAFTSPNRSARGTISQLSDDALQSCVGSDHLVLCGQLARSLTYRSTMHVT